jgi:hypothetical protein
MSHDAGSSEQPLGLPPQGRLFAHAWVRSTTEVPYDALLPLCVWRDDIQVIRTTHEINKIHLGLKCGSYLGCTFDWAFPKSLDDNLSH